MTTRAVAFATLAAVAVLAVSCASMTQKEEWTGRKIDEAVAKLGTPSHVTPGENGEKTYVWMIHRSVPDQRTEFDPNGVPRTYTGSHDSVHIWTFVVNADGIITSWNHEETR